MRRLLPALVLLLPACSSGTDAVSTAPDRPGGPPPLHVGDPAPPLKVGTWVKGDAVAAFEPGTVYVVEFWATWCAPCLQSFPRLNAHALEHKAAGLKVVAVTTADSQGNTLDKVRAFALTGKGSKYDFAFAFCDADDTFEAYMEASGRKGIPASFVVDRAGKVAFIGHPAELDDVLPRVLAGTWPGLPGAAEVKKANDELDALVEAVDTAEKKAAEAAQAAGQDATAAGKAAATKAAADCLAALAAFEKTYPDKATRPAYRGQKMQIALQAGRTDDVKPLAEGLLAHATKVNDLQTLNAVRGLLSDKKTNPTRAHAEIAAAAADAILAAEGDTDVMALLGGVEAYHAAGQTSKADNCAMKVLDLAKDPKVRARFEQAIKAVRE